MLPDHLRWTDPRPPYPLDPQDPVTLIVRDPQFRDPTDEDDCTSFGYYCFNHQQHYLHAECGDGPHEIALSCSRHGFENLTANMQMLWNPTGFDPGLSDAQLDELR